MTSTVILSDNGASSGSAGLKSTAGNDGVLILQTTTSGGTATNAVYVDNAQNIGVGVVPSSLSTSVKSIELPGGAINSYLTDGLNLPQNAYFSASNAWTYKNTAVASLLQQYQGTLALYAAGSGTAGTAISFTKVIAASKDYTVSLQGASQYAGTGITFPATQSASTNVNTLDDYEEGTWTPFFTGSGGNPTINYNTQQGIYTKIGNVVTVSLRIITNSISGGSGNLSVAGLPFTSVASPGSVLYSTPLSFVYAFSLNPTMGFIDANNTSISLYSSSATNTQSTVANLGAGVVYFSLTATYQAA